MFTLALGDLIGLLRRERQLEHKGCTLARQRLDVQPTTVGFREPPRDR
jgi:hypothetical protein